MPFLDCPPRSHRSQWLYQPITLNDGHAPILVPIHELILVYSPVKYSSLSCTMQKSSSPPECGNNTSVRSSEDVENHRLNSNAFYQQRKRFPVRTSSKRSNPLVGRVPTTPETPQVVTGISNANIQRSQSTRRNYRQRRDKKRPSPLQVASKSVERPATHPTQRAEIEARTEKKLFKMMGVTPDTPTSLDDGEDPNAPPVIARYDYTKQKDQKTKPKSPKRKFLGLNISMPNFGAAPPTPTHDSIPMTPSGHDVPPKAAQILGSVNAKKRSPTATSQLNQSSAADDESAEAVFPQLYNGTPIPKLEPNKTVSHKRNNSAGNPPRAVDVKEKHQTSQSSPGVERSQSLRYFDNDTPPTPPAKNTPPQRKNTPPGMPDQGQGIVIGSVPLHKTKFGNKSVGPFELPGDSNVMGNSPGIFSMKAIVEEQHEAAHAVFTQHANEKTETLSDEGPKTGSSGQRSTSSGRLPATTYSPSIYPPNFASPNPETLPPTVSG